MNSRNTKKNRILASGVDLLSCSGLGELTIGILAERSGVSKSGLFAHFKSKEALQIELLNRSAELAQKFVIGPAFVSPEGLPRLRSLISLWLGWTTRAGLNGGCPVAAGMFELDDSSGAVRDHLLQMEEHWRALLRKLVEDAVELGHFSVNLDIDQFVWELCGIYLSHHASSRFVRDPKSYRRAVAAVESLIQRSLVRVQARPKMMIAKKI